MRIFETVVIHHPEHYGQPLIIAKDAFDPQKHQLYDVVWQGKENPEEIKEVTTPPQNREEELKQLYQSKGWRAIKELADKYGIERPEDGWDAAIPLILKAEEGANQ